MDPKNKYMNIILPSTGMRILPDDSSQLETECLYGEKVQLVEEKQDWVYCKLLIDNYFGWIKKSSLGNVKNTTHRVHKVRSFVYSDNNIKSNIINYLPMGSKISISKEGKEWSEINLSNLKNFNVGYVLTKDISKLNNKIKNWVSKAEQLKETPYKWGGRDTLGIDCSALLQLAYENYGECIPRNTYDQMKINKKSISSIDNLKRGYVVFWDRHVGIMVDHLNCIHANAFHMKTIIEPLNEINNRMGSKEKIIKILNFN
jgi:SH3-like domain-containing protein